MNTQLKSQSIDAGRPIGDRECIRKSLELGEKQERNMQQPRERHDIKDNIRDKMQAAQLWAIEDTLLCLEFVLSLLQSTNFLRRFQ